LVEQIAFYIETRDTHLQSFFVCPVNMAALDRSFHLTETGNAQGLLMAVETGMSRRTHG